MSKTTESGSPHPLDISLGSRIRLRRRELGFSQEQLEIAQALKCGIVDIVGDLDQSKGGEPFSRHMASLSEPGAAELLDAYASISSPKHRRAILNLAKQLAEGKATELLAVNE